MPKSVPWDTLLELIGRFPEGVSLEQLMVGLDPTVPRRTLQRWLSSLVKNHDLIALGKGRARRYQLFHVHAKKPSEPLRSFPFHLSKEAASIQAQVTQPLNVRSPVTYHRAFLEDYMPNTTYYLPDTLRKKLLLLGDSRGKQYPAGTYARQILNRLLIDLSWNSSRLEGNSYSLLETERLLEEGKVPAGKDTKETQMILNHKAAIEFLIYSPEMGVNRYTILNLHTLLSDNLLPDPAASGRLRTFSVGIFQSRYVPIAIPQMIEECFNLLISKAGQIKDPFEQAFFLMVHLPYLQAFDDVNKRTSRLAANVPLIRNNLCPLSFIDVPEQLYINGLLGIYELKRIELLRDVFAWAYERSCILYSTTCQSIGEPDPFRLQYRNAIKQTVGKIVHHKMNKIQAVDAIRKQAIDSIPPHDQSRFIEIVERELLNLHEGNIARYQLRPMEYEQWKKSWQ